MEVSMFNESSLGLNVTGLNDNIFSCPPVTTSCGNLFKSHTQQRKNIWWQAFRKAVLEPYSIYVVEKAALHRIPPAFFGVVEQNCEDIQRYELQASLFQDAVFTGRGLGSCPFFVSDILPSLSSQGNVERCIEPNLDIYVVPPRQNSLDKFKFDLPTPCPSLACGFAANAFTAAQLQKLPSWIAPSGTTQNYITRRISKRTIHCPFFLLNRAHGSSKCEIEAAQNCCAIDGSSALHALHMLYGRVRPSDHDEEIADPVVFSCSLDDNIAIINQHWMIRGEGYFMAPLSRFNLREKEHTMHFLAWVNAVQMWGELYLLPTIRKALQIEIDNQDEAIFDLSKDSPGLATISENEGLPIAQTAQSSQDQSWSIRSFFDHPDRTTHSTPVDNIVRMYDHSIMLSHKRAASADPVVKPLGFHSASYTQPVRQEEFSNLLARRHAQARSRECPETKKEREALNLVSPNLVATFTQNDKGRESTRNATDSLGLPENRPVVRRSPDGLPGFRSQEEADEALERLKQRTTTRTAAVPVKPHIWKSPPPTQGNTNEVYHDSNKAATTPDLGQEVQRHLKHGRSFTAPFIPYDGSFLQPPSSSSVYSNSTSASPKSDHSFHLLGPMKSLPGLRKDKKSNMSLAHDATTFASAGSILKSKLNHSFDVIREKAVPKRSHPDPAIQLRLDTSNLPNKDIPSSLPPPPPLTARTQQPILPNVYGAKYDHLNPPSHTTTPETIDAWIDHILSERTVCFLGTPKYRSFGPGKDAPIVRISNECASAVTPSLPQPISWK